MPVSDFLPPGLAASDVRACLALVSDTHMPRRCRAFPAALFDVLAGADLVLHAGDVGKLWVLDQLSDLAPVVAVHGNDETREATAVLPYSTVVAADGARVFLWHSHYTDWHEERASRQGEEILPKLQRTVEHARAAGASLAVFGHWHTPLLWDAGDLLVVNPGAIASGNEITRQLHQTVALAWRVAQAPHWRIVHVDVTGAPALWDATVDWDAGFSTMGARYQESILDRSLADLMPGILAQTPRDLLDPMREVVLALAHRVWAGELPRLTLDMLVREGETANVLAPEAAARLRALAADADAHRGAATAPLERGNP